MHSRIRELGLANVSSWIIIILMIPQPSFSFSFLRQFPFFSLNNTSTLIPDNLDATSITSTTYITTETTIIPTFTSTNAVETTTTSQPYPHNYHYYHHNSTNVMNNSTDKESVGFEDRYDFYIHNLRINKTSSYHILNSDYLKPFEVIIQNDKTMAHLLFDKSGRDLNKCQLFDLEKDLIIIEPIKQLIKKKSPLLVNHTTMLEAVRRCTNLALDNYYKTINRKEDSLDIYNKTNTVESSTEPELMGNTTTNISSLIGTTSPKPGTISYDYSTNAAAFLRGILPGTRWCGLGDIASRYEDLGFKMDIDLCCRAHDHCPIRLKAFHTGYGVFNLSFYSRLHCDCDEDFYNCLKKSSKNYASMLGHFYFNVLKIYCLKEDMTFANTSNVVPTTLAPIKVCLDHKATSIGKEECTKYGVIPDSGTKMKIIPFGRYF